MGGTPRLVPVRAGLWRRGFVLPYVMLLCFIVVAFSAVLLSGALNVAHGARSIEGKNSAFNAAEAGLNAGLEALNISHSNTASTTGTLANSYVYSYTIYSNLGGGLGISIGDPIKGHGSVQVPGDSALIVSVGSDPNGGRPSTVEALVAAHSVTVNFQKYAIIAGRNIQGSYQNGISDLANRGEAFVQADGSINATIASGVQGNAFASGDTNTLPPGRTGAKALALPTVGQFDTLVSNYEDTVKVSPGAANQYASVGSTLVSNYDCPTPAPVDGCLLFYDGPLELTSQQITFTGPWTLIINGDFTQGSPASVTFADKPGLIVANGNASIEGNGLKNAYVEVKGSTLFGGPGTFTGALITLGNFTFDSDNSSGAFRFDATVVPPAKTITGRVKVVTYAEY